LLKPTCNDADVANQCTLEQLYNSYDNTILYTDYVLGEILQRLELSGAPYVFIYLSDHGESLMDEGRMFHGMPPGVALPPEQAQIPLIVRASVPIEIVERAEYRQQDVFDTVLDLLSIETPILDSRASFIKRRLSLRQQ
jgi:lipid A ethanolaminephosphotransferase